MIESLPALYEVVKEVQKDVKDIKQITNELRVLNAKREHYYQQIDSNRELLQAHEARLGKVEGRVQLILYIFVGLVTPMLTAIGIGVVRLLQIGAP